MGPVEGEVVVSAGGGDNMMGAIGTGNVQAGVVTVSLGTSAAPSTRLRTKPVIDPEGEVAAFCDSTDRWLPLVCTMNVTVATEQVREDVRLDSRAARDATSPRAPPGADGLLFLPYLNGERTPNLPLGTGVFHGLDHENMTPAAPRARGHGRRHARARLRSRRASANSASTRRKSASPAAAARAPSGGRSAPTFSACRRSVSQSAEGAALGAAIQAGFAQHAATGQSVTFRELCKRIVKLDEDSRAEPDAANKEIYLEALTRQGDLTRRLHASGYL